MSIMSVIFDTDCVLCSGFVHFILRNERNSDIVFVNAWSKSGLAMAAEHGLSPMELDRTYLVVKDGVGHVRSDAGLVILDYLRMPWRMLRLLRFCPRFLRDGVYSVVARNRYALFGNKSQCFVPPPDAVQRFIDD